MEATEKFHYEQYAEEQFERTANGFEEETFVQWKRRKEAMRKLFAKLREEK